jgi:signal peptidase I
MRGLPRSRERGWGSVRALGRPLALFAAVFAVQEGYLWESARLTVRADLLLGLLVPVGMFALFWLWTRWDRRSLRDYGFYLPRPLLPATAIAGFLVAMQAAVLLEPGFGFGFARIPLLDPRSFGFTLALAPLTALAEESVFRGYIFGRLLAPGRFAAALAISSALFAAISTNFPILPRLGTVELGTYLLTTTATAFTLGLLLGFYFYRTSRNLYGPFVFRTGILLFASLSPIAALSNGWEITFLVALLADGVVLLVLLASAREPKLVARAYLGETFGPKRDRFLGVLRRRQTIRDAAITVAIALVAIGAGIGGVEATLGTTHPFLAIATGSMVPTLVRGDLVVIQHVPVSAIMVGTIIAYRSTCLPSPVVHRVVSLTIGANGTTYTTKGDANPSSDPCPVPYSAVLGKVVSIVPYLGIFVLAPELTVAVAAVVVVTVMLMWPDASRRFPRRRPAE